MHADLCREGYVSVCASQTTLCSPEASARGPRRSLTHCDLPSLERVASEAQGRPAARNTAKVVPVVTRASGFCFGCV